MLPPLLGNWLAYYIRPLLKVRILRINSTHANFIITNKAGLSASTELACGVAYNPNNYSPIKSLSKKKTINTKVFQYLEIHVEGV